MAWLSVNKNGNEFFHDAIPNWEDGFWSTQSQRNDKRGALFCDFPTNAVQVPSGTIELILGRKMTWEDEPVFLTEDIVNRKLFPCKIKKEKTEDSYYECENDKDSVDLGLSVRWCKCNLGADSPEEFGDYYGWGMTEPYKEGVDDVYWELYNHFPASKIKTDLTDETDAATVKLGKRYRMPTEEECQELIDNCIWEWTQMNGVDGYKVMNKKDHSKFIFLPAAGSLNGLSNYNVGRYGNYWSRSRISAVYGWELNFDSGDCDVYADGSFNGLSVRPVKVKLIRTDYGKHNGIIDEKTKIKRYN